MTIAGMLLGGIIGAVTYMFLISSFAFNCGPEWAGEGFQYFPGRCTHIIIVFPAIFIVFVLCLFMSFFGCYLADKRYSDHPYHNGLLLVGGVLGGLIIPFVYAILLALGLLLESISI